MTIQPPKKRSIAKKVSFWSQFAGSLLPLLFRGKEDKQKVMDIANGISQTADVIVQVQENEMPYSTDANLPSAPPSINGENP